SLPYSPKYDRSIDTAEAERIAHHVIQRSRPAVVWDNIEIARWIGILIIDRRRNPLPIQRECAKRRFNCTCRAERMRIITLGPTYRDAPCMIAEYLFDRRRFRAVVKLCRTGVRVDVIDLLRRQLSVRQRFTHRTDARFATR